MFYRANIGLAVAITCFAVFGCGSSDPPAAADNAAPGSTANAASTTTSQSSAGVGEAPVTAPKQDPLHPVVAIDTSRGKIVARLNAEKAPVTVQNFLNYINSSHYDGTLIHYVDPGSMILGGGFDETLEPKTPSGPIRNEAHNGLKNVRGTIVMSRNPDYIDSATSQFFINVKDNPALDHRDSTPEGYGYCVFGEIIEGMEIVDAISQADVQDSGDFVNTPQERVVIESVRTLR